MAQYLSNELAGTTTGQSTSANVGYKPKASVYGAKLKRLRATITLAGQLTTDTLQFGNLPAGAVFAFGVLNSTVSLGTSTLSIGPAATPSKYKAAGTLTSTDTPTMFGTAAQEAAVDTGLTAEETVLGTIGGAALPASGTLVVDLFYSMPQ